MPADVERPVGREEVERRVRQVLVHPSRKDPPIAGLLMFRPETGYDNASHRPHVAVSVEAIPDVPCVVALIRGAGVSSARRTTNVK